jgi:two-component system response regulator YesN
LQIILLTLRSNQNSGGQYEYQGHTETPGKLVYLIMKYVDLNIEKPLTVHGIAESLGYSIYHISHIFKEKTDITLQDYIASKKIEKAREMMLRGRLTLTEIADKLGYMSIQSFSRSFKKKEGVSPSEYINNSK